MSGVVYSSWVFAPPLNYAKRLAMQLGWNGSTEANMLNFLENRKPFELIAASGNILTRDEKYGFLIPFPFGPVVEPLWSKNSFISQNPTRMARSAWSKDIDCIIGVTSFEGLFQAFREYQDDANEYIDVFNENVAFYAPLIELGVKENSVEGKTYGKKIKEIYYKDKEMTKDNLIPYYQVKF